MYCLLYGKMHKLPFKSLDTVYTEPLELIEVLPLFICLVFLTTSPLLMPIHGSPGLHSSLTNLIHLNPFLIFKQWQKGAMIRKLKKFKLIMEQSSTCLNIISSEMVSYIGSFVHTLHPKMALLNAKIDTLLKRVSLSELKLRYH